MLFGVIGGAFERLGTGLGTDILASARLLGRGDGRKHSFQVELMRVNWGAGFERKMPLLGE
jgi:hypothetical protein